MAQQLRGYLPLTRRLAADWRQVVVLERFARSAGAARWFFAANMATLEYVFDVLLWGSSVSFYFARHLQVEADNEDSRQVMFDLRFIAPNGIGAVYSRAGIFQYFGRFTYRWQSRWLKRLLRIGREW
jgi:hypothetical protein